MKFALFLALAFASVAESISVKQMTEVDPSDEFVAAQVESETTTAGVDCCKKNPNMEEGSTRMHIIRAPTKYVITHSIQKNGDHVKCVKS